MHFQSLMSLVVLTAFFCLVSPFLGRYMAIIFHEKASIPFLGKIEYFIYRLCKVDPKEEMDWKGYAKSLFIFNLWGFLALLGLQLLQKWLPFNPQHFPHVPFLLALNSAISFVTNTNWQAYAGETTLSYLTQMLGMAVQNFLSAASGMSALLVLIRGLSREGVAKLGNFFVDMTKTVLYLLLPLSILLAFFLISAGVIQNFRAYPTFLTVEKENQTLPMGPAASQIAIKQIGSNGGGFFNANSSHPFENPSPFTNFLENFAILLIPAAAPFMFGRIMKAQKQGFLIFAVMLFLWIGGVGLAMYFETLHNPQFSVAPFLEGKEVRLGSESSVYWAISTTATSNGSVNNMHSSLSPLAGGMALFNIMLGEVVFGGVGVGLIGMLMFIFLTLFLAGLMVGRTPEFLGKKIEIREMRWVMLAILLPSALILLGSGIACLSTDALQRLSGKGPHTLTELIYAFTSSSGNNGSAFAGLNANVPFYNIALGLCMLGSRIVALLAPVVIAGELASKKKLAKTTGTFETDSLLFGILLVSVIIIVGGLTFFPSLALGPIVEHILMLKGEIF